MTKFSSKIQGKISKQHISRVGNIIVDSNGWLQLKTLREDSQETLAFVIKYGRSGVVFPFHQFLDESLANRIGIIYDHICHIYDHIKFASTKVSL